MMSNMILRRFASASSSNINVTMRGVNAVVAMNKAPANLLSREFMVELTETLYKLDSDKATKGIVFTSALPRIFSGGLDLAELYQPKPERLASFWSALQDLWLTFYSLKTPSVAAINGAAPAGGCMMSMCCDERIMLSTAGIIGLNETKLGIVAPHNIFARPFGRLVGQRNAERCLQTGALLKPDEAKLIGLIDRVVSSDDELHTQCDAVLATYQAVPSSSREAQKMLLRGDLIALQQKERVADTEAFVSLITQAHVQANLGAYLASMKKKS